MKLLIAFLILFSANAYADSGLIFPDNGAVSNSTANSPRFFWANPQTIGLPAFGNGANPTTGLTYIWKYMPYAQISSNVAPGNCTTLGPHCVQEIPGASFYSTMFWSNGTSFTGEYYGPLPYPSTGGICWNISHNNNDTCGSTPTAYIATSGFERWYTQVFTVYRDASGNKVMNFYWDWPLQDAVHTVSITSASVNPPECVATSSCALSFGDAPWSPGNEISYGILRGIQIYTIILNPIQINAELVNPIQTGSVGAQYIWYINVNPTPTDITDKSGKGHNPSWAGTNLSTRPTLYQTAGPTPNAPTNLRIQ